MPYRSVSEAKGGLELPGFDESIHWYPVPGDLFPYALDDNDVQCRIFTVRELTMMGIMESITDKPDWDKKVFNEEITRKWREEMANSGKDVSPAMIEWIIQELQWRAREYETLGFIQSFDPGVTKSDTAIPPDLQQELKDAVRSLEVVPPEQKDYHPRSDNKVVDLVHPSLFPVIYGRTKVLPDRRIGIDDCFQSVGEGESTKYPVVDGETPPENLAIDDSRNIIEWFNGYSRRFQWMPCEVEFKDDGECRVASYINNLHPHKHRDLYRVIEKILARTIPLWNRTLVAKPDVHSHRIPYGLIEYLDSDIPEPQDEDFSDDDEYWEELEEWKSKRPVKQPEPKDFTPPEPPSGGWLDLRDKYAEKGLQVIVKLASIELTPEKPEYGGGTWHIEAQKNERICATAIYYYNCENITESRLSFRHRADNEYLTNEVGYEQGDHTFLPAVFGFSPDTNTYNDDAQITQDLGSVTSCEGRLLTFPNILQHRVSPFSLADRSKPGHRKILAFFLIDPGRRVISSANVPPQREDWCKEWQDSVESVLSNRLPQELQNMVQKDLDYTPMTMDEAKEYRIQLMDERGVLEKYQNREFEMGGFSLCEH